VGELTTAAATTYKELGAIAVLILAGLFGLGFLIWRITVTQDRITTLLDKLFACTDEHRLSLGVHDRQAQSIVGDVADIKKMVTEIKGKVC
jgi:hypothetical protein